jgi:predicted nucleic acid-binding protein
VKYLIDANVWLEAILGRANAGDVRALLSRAVQGTLATTDYSIHSVGLYLYRDNPMAFRQFLDDLVRLRINTLHLAPSNLFEVLEIAQRHSLDFDDAFQYVAADRDHLEIVSFDTDFDRTPRGRKTPGQVLTELASVR